MHIPKRPMVEQPAVLIPAPAVNAAAVARLLGYAAAEYFYRRRPALERLGFPPKLPGVNAWSSAAVLRWIETNGETYLPAAPPAPSETAGRITRLERRFAS